MSPSKQRFQLSTLENTPKVDEIKRNPTIKKALLIFIKRPENIKKLDQGLLVIPEKYLVQKASSRTLHGLSRLANRPFDQIFSENDFIDVSFSNTINIQSPYALLRHLNDMSYAGCHQARTIAGFHFIGKDSPSTTAVNSIHVAQSPHFLGYIPRRYHYVSTLINDQKPNAVRPFSERAATSEGGIGSHCSLKKDLSFAGWNYHQGLHCENINGNNDAPIGRCATDKPIAGSACRAGVFREHANPLKDRLLKTNNLSCGQGNH